VGLNDQSMGCHTVWGTEQACNLKGERRRRRRREIFQKRLYVEQIMDKELFDFWASSMEELGDVLIMEDGAGYHKGAATIRRKEYESEGGWHGWGPHTYGRLILLT